MDLELSSEQRAVVETTRAFVHRELVPHEDEVERSGRLDPQLARQLRDRAIRAGLYAANMPEEVGGGGLDTLTWMLMERELGHTGYALQMYAVARPSRILLACNDSQHSEYLLPTVAGVRTECLAMTEPEAGSDLRGMRTRAVRDGADWVITGTKHFISHADESDFVVLFAATGEQAAGDDGPRRAEITAFLVDLDTPGLDVLPGYRSVSHRGYGNCVLAFDGCRVPGSAVLGEVGRGFDVANTWLGSTRLQVAATCLVVGFPGGGAPGVPGARDLPGPGPSSAGAGGGARGRPQSVRPTDRPQPGCVVQAGRHGHRTRGRDVAHLARGLAGGHRAAG